MLAIIQGSGTTGPDICYLLGFCQTSGGLASGSNLLFLATAFLVAGVLVHRSGKKKR